MTDVKKVAQQVQAEMKPREANAEKKLELREVSRQQIPDINGDKVSDFCVVNEDRKSDRSGEKLRLPTYRFGNVKDYSQPLSSSQLEKFREFSVGEFMKVDGEVYTITRFLAYPKGDCDSEPEIQIYMRPWGGGEEIMRRYEDVKGLDVDPGSELIDPWSEI